MKDLSKNILWIGGVAALFSTSSDAFVATSRKEHVQRQHLPSFYILSQQSLLVTRDPQIADNVQTTTSAVFASQSPNSSSSSSDENKNQLYTLLQTGRDQKPNRGNFFYNDEVSSHLYGYMYLVGFFAAQDPLFLGSFLVFSALAAWATQEDILPANPRVPAVISAITLMTTLLCRYVVGFEFPVQDILGDVYQGPTDLALVFEVGIAALNVAWGLFGTWQTKEQRNGATYGF